MSFVFEPAARQDLLDATRWYLEEAGPLRARQFETEIHRSLSLLVRLPALGAPIRHGVRKLPLRRFPYSLVYRDESGLIRVLALAHQRRQPGYWAKRRQRHLG